MVIRLLSIALLGSVQGALLGLAIVGAVRRDFALTVCSLLGAAALGVVLIALMPWEPRR